jgi:hypothetical protein
MPSSTVHTFTDPDAYHAAIRDAHGKGIVTERGTFGAEMRLHLNRNPFDLVQRDLIASAVVKLGRAGAFMRRHGLSVLQRAAGFKIGGDTRGAECMGADLGLPHISCSMNVGSGIIRARNSSVPARPYMARLRVFNRLICPSVWPLLHGSVTAFLTAQMSCRNVRAKRCIA